MKKIVVPVDFSEYSEYALEAAAILGKRYQAEIIVLHMLELSKSLVSNSGTDLQNETLFYLQLTEKKFSTFLDKSYLENIKVTPIIKHFKVFSEVNEIAKQHEADLVIMGSHGASGLKEVFVGSNTEKVVRHSDVPVLILKHSPILMDFESAIFACDFSEEALKPYLNAKSMFDVMGLNMQLIYVNTPNSTFRSSSEIEKKVALFLKKANVNLNLLKEIAYVSDYTIEQGVLNYANLKGVDLIALATHGRKGFSHFFEGSISEDIANHSTLPVMTFKI